MFRVFGGQGWGEGVEDIDWDLGFRVFKFRI